MTLKQALAALQKAGTAQNRKVYGNHGVSGPMYGVSFAELKKLKKQIKQDHELACGLWDTGNHDARILACMVADAGVMTSRDLDGWARQLDSYVISDAFSSLVARSPLALKKFLAWRDRKGEWVAAAAWNVLSHLAVDDAADLPDGLCAEQIQVITAEIHRRPNRVRHSMNQALIAVGARNGKLEKLALKAAAAIGKVEVDHGQTSCQTPDAAAYIRKTVEYRKKKGRR
jgi:3-methyladenine DNA glycosylase AlkD